MGRQPLHVGLAGVLLRSWPAEVVLCGEATGQRHEPTVIAGARASPDCAGVIFVRRSVPRLATALSTGCAEQLFPVVVARKEMPRRPEQLCTLQQHLDYVAVAMPGGGLAWI